MEENMKVLIIISLCFLLAGCGDGCHNNRSYVISKAQVEPELKDDTAEH